jgi:hypothetical protein
MKSADAMALKSLRERGQGSRVLDRIVLAMVIIDLIQ